MKAIRKRNLLSVLLAFLFALSGCTKNSDNTSDNSPKKPPQEITQRTSAVNPPGVFPITEKPVVLRVFTPQSPYVEEYTTNDFALYYEEKTNLHIHWDLVLRSNLEDTVQMRLASGDLPDVFLQSGLTDATVVHYENKGDLLPLNDLITEYAPNTHRIMEENSYIKDSMVTPDGNIYHIPNVGEVLHASMPKKAWVYKPWRQALGLPLPRTTDEFYQMLQEFQTNDMNGNGVKDEIPFAGANSSHNEIESYLLQSFVFYDRTSYLGMEDGNVFFAPITNEYRDGLYYIRKLMQEGLIAPESFTQDRIALTSLAEAPDGTRLGVATAMYWGHFTDSSQSERYKEYEPLPVLKGPDGNAYGYDRGYGPSIGRDIGAFVITNACKLPQAAIRWMDEIYDQDKTLAWDHHPNMGIEGVDWRRNPPGLLGLDGQPASYELITPFGTKQNTHLSQTMNSFNSYHYRMRGAVTDETETRLFQATAELYKPFSAHDMQVPFVFLSEEDNARISDLLTSLHNVVQSYLVKFTTGSLLIEEYWAEYLRELYNVGMNEYVEIIQRAIEQHNS